MSPSDFPPPGICPLCCVLAGDIPHSKVLETPNWYAILDIRPLGTGHVLLFPKRHVQYLHRLTDDVLQEMGPVLGYICAGVNDDFNVLVNQGERAHGLPVNAQVDHLKIHVIPKPVAGHGGGLKMVWWAEPQSKEVLLQQSVRYQRAIKERLEQ